MGGSLALALRGRAGSLIGVDRQPLTLQQAREGRVVDVITEDLAGGLAAADLVVLAVPVRAILDILRQLPELVPQGCRVMDMGSTKAAVVAAMSALPPAFEAIGGHPMCGKETAGLASADADLYRDKLFLLCRSGRTTPGLEAAARALVEAVGAHPALLDPADHDAIVAQVSHLPYLSAAALMRLAADETQWEVSASGFRDSSRLAGSDPRMMLDVMLTNREAVLAALDRYTADLSDFRQLLTAADEAGLREWMAEAQVRYAAYRRYRSGGEIAP
jgi:prephenate dehydrogenase